jgi:hypothetical protein
MNVAMVNVSCEVGLGKKSGRIESRPSVVPIQPETTVGRKKNAPRD